MRLLAIVGCLALALASLAQAQTPATVNAAATVGWTAPTTGGGGTIPLTGANALTGFNVYASSVPLTAVPTTAPLVTAAATATTITGTSQATVGTTLYVYVVACNANGCSGLSPAAMLAIPNPGVAPDSVTNVTLTVKITQATH